jgi:hypothetical protein
VATNAAGGLFGIVNVLPGRPGLPPATLPKPIKTDTPRPDAIKKLLEPNCEDTKITAEQVVERILNDSLTKVIQGEVVEASPLGPVLLTPEKPRQRLR